MKIILFILGVAMGGIATFILLRAENSPEQQTSSVARNLLVDSSIEALDLLRSGDSVSAELILASSVNSQVLVVQKMASSTAAEKALSAKWEDRMVEHNRRLNLVMPKRQAQ